MKYYILRGKQIVITHDVLEFGKFLSSPEKIIRQTTQCGVLISTVFLGIAQTSIFFTNPNNLPVLFETMVFAQQDKPYLERYCTYDQALNGHRRVVHQLDLGVFSNNWFKYNFNRFIVFIKNVFKKNENINY